jgi:hypothetical protein
MCSSGKGHEFSLFGWGLAGLTLDAQNIATFRVLFVCVFLCLCTRVRVCNTDSVCVCSLNGLNLGKKDLKLLCRCEGHCPHLIETEDVERGRGLRIDNNK